MIYNNIRNFGRRQKMNSKQMFQKLKYSSISYILKSFLLSILLLLLFSVTFFYSFSFLFPAVKNILKPFFLFGMTSIPKSDTQTVFEAILNGANFAIVYISILFALTALIVTFAGIWWSRKISLLERCHQDYERFKRNSPLEARLTTSKIFVIDERYSEALEQIKDLPNDFDYEVPFYKAKILLAQPHEDSVFSAVIKLLNNALSFSNLTEETKSIINREISRAYFKERKDYGKALEYAEKAIEEDYSHWSAHNAKALALRHLGDLEKAIEVLEDVVKEYKKYDAAYYNLACYYCEKSRKEKDPKKISNLKETAISNYKIAIKLDPKNKKFAKTDTDLDPISNEINKL